MADKQAAWALIKLKSPDLAEFIRLLAAEFGKPAALRVEWPSGEVVESGVFKPPYPRLCLSRR